MWFKSALIYQYALSSEFDIEAYLEKEILKPCPPHARSIHGFTHVFSDALVHEIAGAQMFCMGKEERVLPKAVIKKMLEEKIQHLEITENKSLSRSEKAQLAEDLEFELLPKAFCIQKKCFAYFDTHNQRLIINSSSQNQASQLTTLLRKAIPELSIYPLDFEDNLPTQFTNFLTHPNLLPQSFELAKDCALFSPSEEKKRFNCKGVELPAPEVSSLVEQGLLPSELSFLWNERLQFTLTQEFTLKRIKCLDYLVDEFHEIGKIDEEIEQKDAAFTLLSGELRTLINELLSLFSTSVKKASEEQAA